MSHVNLRAEDGATALMMAAQAGRITCVQTLLDFGADVNIEVCTMLPLKDHPSGLILLLSELK